jgi:hypothetical protein
MLPDVIVFWVVTLHCVTTQKTVMSIFTTVITLHSKCYIFRGFPKLDIVPIGFM